MKVRDSILRYADEILKIRRDLHRIPECANREEETSGYLYRYLKMLNPDKLEHCAKTGLKAVFYASGAARTVAVRADMDALPIMEKTGAEYASRHAGRMHACGHDGHMAIALICAKIVSRMRNELRSNFVFIFQPAEEDTGGALPMIEEGILSDPDVDEIYGIHLWPYLPFGKVGCKEGPMMAGMSDINIEIKGRGGHGAKPQNGRDALVAAASFVGSVQTIVSRNIDPFKTAVFTIGKIEGGVQRNVICDRVRLEGTIRTFEPEVKNTIYERVEQMLKGYETAFSVSCAYEECMEYPPVTNPKALFCRMKERFSRDEFAAAEPVMMAEDFSYYQKEIPGLFAFIGIAEEEQTAPLHSDCFDFNESALLNGVEYFMRVTQD